jgi:integrase
MAAGATIANGLEWSYGWQAAAAQRLRFLLDFGYATGLRISELANAALRHLDADALGDHWLHLVGKGGKPARVALTPLARQRWNATCWSASSCQPRSLEPHYALNR